MRHHQCGISSNKPFDYVLLDVDDDEALRVLADATYLEPNGPDAEDSLRRLHRLGYTLARLSNQPSTELEPGCAFIGAFMGDPQRCDEPPEAELHGPAGHEYIAP